MEVVQIPKVDEPLRNLQHVKEPGAVRVQHGARHDEHVEHVATRLVEVGVQVLQALRAHRPHAFAQGAQLRAILVKGMPVVRGDGLDVVVARLGHHHLALRGQCGSFLGRQHPTLARARKVPTVVHQAQPVARKVPPAPPQGRQLAVARVLLRDVIALVIVRKALQMLMLGRAHLHRLVQRVTRHPVRLMGSDQYLDGLCLAHVRPSRSVETMTPL